ncbi:MAG: D-alanyl-D-alanine carboxypeptidase family protein [Microthrixaceae bacterium]
MSSQKARRAKVWLPVVVAASVIASGPVTVGASVSSGAASTSRAGVIGKDSGSSKASATRQSKGDDGKTPRLKVKQSAATKDAKGKVNALTATREEIEARLAELDAQYEERQSAALAAAEAVTAAEAKVEESKGRVAAAQEEVRIAQDVVHEYALRTYTKPPAAPSMRILSIGDTQDAGYAKEMLKIMTNERHKVVETLAVKKKIAAMEQDRAQQAVAEAEATSEQAQAELEALAQLRDEQVELVAQMDQRLDDALAEAAALEAIDVEAAKELAAKELALREAANAAKLVAARNAPPKVINVAAPPSTAPSKPTPTKPTTTSPPTTTKPGTTSPPTTSPSPPVSPPAGTVTWADVTYVGGIPVHKSVASQVSAMLNAATAAGFSLTGGGYRDSEGQIRTRMANCGTTYYDIYEKPASQCSPPTAIPGRSMHERGLALDLKSNGSLITSRSNPAFIWLSAHASNYGFYNLPSEPWHWSTTGH